MRTGEVFALQHQNAVSGAFGGMGMCKGSRAARPSANASHG